MRMILSNLKRESKSKDVKWCDRLRELIEII
jgi:hypothetical protein